ncbi:hypothetical protein MMC07_005672 [Pseudocyphellaria aurata]|nr:hypothetical protein [Pseudocyphellaria aurata]
MHFFPAICYLASLVATLVVVTTSLPQSPSGPLEIVSRRSRQNFHPLSHLPRGCPRISARPDQKDIDETKVIQGTAQPLHRRALVPRRTALPCGNLAGGGQSDPFVFPTRHPLRLLWNFGNLAIGHQIVQIMQVNPSGPDFISHQAMAREFGFSGFTPVEGVFYYIRLSGQAAVEMTWFFTYLYPYLSFS